MATETKQCPFCREEVRADAVLCKHCRSKLGDESPDHGGQCPYCKESIHEEAVKCKHCGSSLAREPNPCGCGGQGSRVLLRRRAPGGGYDPTGGSDCTAEYEDCYLDCSFDYVDGSLRQNICFRSCDRKFEICDITGRWPGFGFGRLVRF